MFRANLFFLFKYKPSLQTGHSSLHPSSGIVAALLVFSLFSPLLAQAPRPADGPPPAPVEVSSVIEKEVVTSVTLIGTGEAWIETVVASEQSGLVSDMLVEEGDRVGKGQPLCEQDTKEIKLRIEASRAELGEAEVLKEQAESDYDRQRRLFAINSVSEKAYEDAKFTAEAARKRVSRLRASLSVLEEQLNNKRTRAPVSGYVVQRHCLVGQWLGEGEPVATIVALDPVLFKVPVPERYISAMKKGETAQVTFDALPGKTFQGRIYAVIPRGDDASRTFPVHIEIGNPEGLIKPGMLGRATIPTGERQRAVLVPKDALVLTSTGTVVYTVVDQQARLVPVKTGAEHGSDIEVEGDIEPGLAVVVRGNERLRPGQPVQVIGKDL
jgi:RND family efflux transporter MFP subunit